MKEKEKWIMKKKQMKSYRLKKEKKKKKILASYEVGTMFCQI